MKENEIIKDRYQLLRPLGAGGFGEVWLAKDQMTGTHCALKFYVRLDDEGRDEFRKEYIRMLGIHDAHLLTASYYDEWQGRPFLVMDYCGGGAASGKVGQLGETELWRLIRDVASGLACLHSQRDARGKEVPVIHQDIKPANFLQKDDGTWLISDFGISSRMRSSMSSQSGREVSMGGTIPYMGPERFGQDQDLVKASDIWALGASIYEMAKGKVPFGEFGGGTQRAGAEIPHLPKERWSPDLDRLVSSCLQKETWDRPTAELVSEYADCKLKGKPLPRLPKETLPPPNPNPIPNPKPDPKPKLWKWMTAAGAVVAVVLAILYWPIQQTVSYSDNMIFVDGKAIYKMMPVAGGIFQMGSDDSEADDDEKPVHSVTMSTFYMGETEVTQALWKAVMGTNPSKWKGDNQPVERVSWDDCQKFIRKLNQLTGRSFRLPTEAEWEFAARGGNQSNGYNLAGSNNIGSVAWYYDNSGGKTHAVKDKSPNELGLYDMSGNVYEWCSDWYGSYSSGSQTNPKGPSSGSDRVFRGGCWDDPEWLCRVLCRTYYAPDYRSRDIGFRLCLDDYVADSMVKEQRALAETRTQEVLQLSPSTNTSVTSLIGSANGHEWVDLGLPSGTLWATCNIGASSPEDYGSYFAWGETSTKSTYNWDTYKYANGAKEKLTKYCNKSDCGNNGFTDNLTTLQGSDDPTTSNWSSGWRTPTKTQWDELLENTTDHWTTKNGVKGSLFTSKKNGQSVFLPAAGFPQYGELFYAGHFGEYWSRSLYTSRPNYAWRLGFGPDGCVMSEGKRYNGFSVRPVREK